MVFFVACALLDSRLLHPLAMVLHCNCYCNPLLFIACAIPPFLWKFLTCSKILNVLLWRYNWGFAIYCMCYSPLSAMLLLLPLPLPSFRLAALQCNPIVQCTTTAHTASSLPLLWCVICSVLSCPASSRGMYLLLLSSIVKRGEEGGHPPAFQKGENCCKSSTSWMSAISHLSRFVQFISTTICVFVYL